MPSWRPLTVAAALGAVAILAVAPTGWGLPTGADKDTIQVGEFAAKGCTSSGCHGGGKFAAGGADLINWNITGADGVPISGNTYDAAKPYNIHVILHKRNLRSADFPTNLAGFNLRTTAGKFSVPATPDGKNVQVTSDGTQATHTNPGHTEWNVTWTAPASGVVVFDLFVNDVNGNNQADPGDQVHRVGFWLTDSNGAVAGAVSTGEVQYGISLQQYWIGLIGLAGMVFIMVAGFVYMKYGNRHNTDAKDR